MIPELPTEADVKVALMALPDVPQFRLRGTKTGRVYVDSNRQFLTRHSAEAAQQRHNRSCFEFVGCDFAEAEACDMSVVQHRRIDTCINMGYDVSDMIQEQPTEAEAKAALMQCDAPKPWGNDTSWMRAADPEPRKGFRVW